MPGFPASFPAEGRIRYREGSSEGSHRDTSDHHRQRLQHPDAPDHQRHARHRHGDERRVDARAHRRRDTATSSKRGTTTLDLSIPAARQAIESAGLTPADIDMVVYATMTPDHYMPGNGGLLQSRLGLRNIPCFDIRQQCAGSSTRCSSPTRTFGPASRRPCSSSAPKCTRCSCRSATATWARLLGAVDTPMSDGGVGPQQHRSATSKCCSATVRRRWSCGRTRATTDAA